MKNFKIVLFFILFLIRSVQAQVVNVGEMVLMPNTVVGLTSNFENHLSGTVINDGELYIYSDFKNEGLVTFSSDQNGLTIFEGKNQQKIEGYGSSGFQNMAFNKSAMKSPIELRSEISVAGNADFSRGIVSGRDYGGLLVFERGARHSNTNNDSYLDGEIEKKGEEEFVFPTGNNGYYRNLSISASKEVLSSFKGSYFNVNSDDLYPHINKADVIDLINENEYWVLEKKGGSADVILTLSWDEFTTTPSAIAADPQEDIHIVRWDAVKKIWIDEGGVVNVDKKIVSTPANISEYGVYTLARTSVSNSAPCKKIVVYNAISANGDGLNDYFKIDGLKACGDGTNKVQIYDRWGVKVYETNNYDENGNVFRGFSNVKNLISGNKQLAAGTYFYVLNVNILSDGASRTMNKTGYLYLN